MNLLVILGLAAATAVFIAAASVLKLYTAGGPLYLLFLALGLYLTGNLTMIPLMRATGLGLTVSILSVTQLLLVNVIALVFYGEKISRLQMSGMALGTLAIILMLWPTGEGA